jgi:ankyrin repeat protein
MPGFVSGTGGPLAMPPLVAVTLSKLILEDGFEEGLLACARLLIDNGADVNGRWNDPLYPGSSLSPLYGAAGVTHHPGMTKLLLDAGADPDDNESLYHSVETADLTCTRMLLKSGARVPGTNALGRVLDYDRPDGLKLLLDHGGDPNEHTWLHHAILRGRSLDHIRMLLDAGADPRAVDRNGASVLNWARMHGRMDVVSLLDDLEIDEALDETGLFVVACANGDDETARDIMNRVPDMMSRLPDDQLAALPRLASIGEVDAVRTMLSLGWPRDVKTAWHATALNLAVFQGDARMARLLLEHGADWTTKHGYGDNVLGTLSFASLADEIADPAPLDYAGCARALVEHGVPVSAFETYLFSPEVTEYLESLRRRVPGG